MVKVERKVKHPLYGKIIRRSKKYHAHDEDNSFKAGETVTGEVTLKLYKGAATPAGATSPYSLYNEDIASFGDSHELYSHKDAAGFINLFGLPIKVKALLDAERNNK